MKIININFRLLAVILLLTVVSFTSCKSLKQTFDTFISNSKPDQLIEELVDNHLDFNNIYLRKVSFTVNEGSNKKSFKGAIYIEKNKNIIISVTPLLGIELFKVILDPKLITIVDKMNKNIRYADYSYMEKNFGVELDYSMIENILSNSFFSYPVDIPTRLLKFNIIESSNIYEILQSNRQVKKDNIQQTIQINTQLNKLDSHKIFNTSKNILLNTQYTNFKDLKSDIKFPFSINLNVVTRTNNATIDIQSTQIELNSNNSLSTSIPESYEKIYH